MPRRNRRIRYITPDGATLGYEPRETPPVEWSYPPIVCDPTAAALLLGGPCPCPQHGGKR